MWRYCTHVFLYCINVYMWIINEVVKLHCSYMIDVSVSKSTVSLVFIRKFFLYLSLICFIYLTLQFPNSEKVLFLETTVLVIDR